MKSSEIRSEIVEALKLDLIGPDNAHAQLASVTNAANANLKSALLRAIEQREPKPPR
jgi:hypothetical protein